jgi:hypothetical protein
LNYAIPPTSTVPAIPPQNPLTDWDEYILSLDPWEHDLIVDSQSELTLFTAMQDLNAILLIVSDGSQKFTYGSFGWLIGTQTQILASCSGAARGCPMTSYRAEGYGKLSWICYLFQISTFYGFPIRCKFRNYCDNSSIICATPIPNQHGQETMEEEDDDAPGGCRSCPADNPLRLDYDLILEIKTAQQRLQTVTDNLEDTIHVPGHQDDNQPFESLNRQSQLNVLADKLAKTKLKELL